MGWKDMVKYLFTFVLLTEEINNLKNRIWQLK